MSDETTAATEQSIKPWSTPVATFVPVSDTANGPGTPPDSGGIDYS